jgi:hypothetical protein
LAFSGVKDDSVTRILFCLYTTANWYGNAALNAKESVSRDLFGRSVGGDASFFLLFRRLFYEKCDGATVVSCDVKIIPHPFLLTRHFNSMASEELGTMTLYHATSKPAGDRSFMSGHMMRGSKGMFGAVIYFADSKEQARRKSQHNTSGDDVPIIAEVNLGRTFVLTRSRRHLTLEKCKRSVQLNQRAHQWGRSVGVHGLRIGARSRQLCPRRADSASSPAPWTSELPAS